MKKFFIYLSCLLCPIVNANEQPNIIIFGDSLSAGYGIDDVIDPADTRSWIVMGLNSIPPTPVRTEKKYPYIDTW